MMRNAEGVQELRFNMERLTFDSLQLFASPVLATRVRSIARLLSLPKLYHRIQLHMDNWVCGTQPPPPPFRAGHEKIYSSSCDLASYFAALSVHSDIFRKVLPKLLTADPTRIIVALYCRQLTKYCKPCKTLRTGPNVFVDDGLN